MEHPAPGQTAAYASQTIPNQFQPRGMSSQEALVFLSDPSATIARIRTALLGSCDWIAVKNGDATEMILVEWVPLEKIDENGKRTIERTWISPPRNHPIVDNLALWTYIESHLAVYCAPSFLLNKPEEPEDLSTTIGLDIMQYLMANWEVYHMNLSKAHYICTLISDTIYSVLKASENGDIRKVLTHIYSVNIDNKLDEGKQKGLGETVMTAIGVKK